MPRLNETDDLDDILEVAKVFRALSWFMGHHAERLLSQEQAARADVATTDLIRVLSEIMPEDAPKLAPRPHEVGN